MGIFSVLVILVQTMGAKGNHSGLPLRLNLNAKYSENFANLGEIFERLYIHFDDTTMTMLAAPALGLLGIKFMHQRHHWQKYRNILRACQGKN
jgi:hypothetical protein